MTPKSVCLLPKTQSSSSSKTAPSSLARTRRNMLAQKFTISAKAVNVTSAKVQKRGQTIVRRNSKGGEEGARDFGNSYVSRDAMTRSGRWARVRDARTRARGA